MALIQCPECGKQVSDKAAACPNCAYPLANQEKMHTVKIKLTPAGVPPSTIYAKSYSTIQVKYSAQTLWSGYQNQTASFIISAPTKIVINTKIGYPFETVVKPGGRYQITIAKIGWRVHYTLTEVDFIDAE